MLRSRRPRCCLGLMLALAACAPARTDDSLVVASGAPAVEGHDGESRSYLVRVLRTPEANVYEARLRRARIGDSFDGVPPELLLAEMTKAAARIAAELCPQPELRPGPRLGGLFTQRRGDEPPDERILWVRCPPGQPAEPSPTRD